MLEHKTKIGTIAGMVALTLASFSPELRAAEKDSEESQSQKVEGKAEPESQTTETFTVCEKDQTVFQQTIYLPYKPDQVLEKLMELALSSDNAEDYKAFYGKILNDSTFKLIDMDGDFYSGGYTLTVEKELHVPNAEGKLEPKKFKFDVQQSGDQGSDIITTTDLLGAKLQLTDHLAARSLFNRTVIGALTEKEYEALPEDVKKELGDKAPEGFTRVRFECKGEYEADGELMKNKSALDAFRKNTEEGMRLACKGNAARFKEALTELLK